MDKLKDFFHNKLVVFPPRAANSTRPKVNPVLPDWDDKENIPATPQPEKIIEHTLTPLLEIYIKKTGIGGCGHVSATLIAPNGDQPLHLSLSPSNPLGEYMTTIFLGQVPVPAFNESNPAEDLDSADQRFSIPLDLEKYELTKIAMGQHIKKIESGDLMYALGASSRFGTFFPTSIVSMVKHTTAGVKEKNQLKMGRQSVADTASSEESPCVIHNCVSVVSDVLKTIFYKDGFRDQAVCMPHELADYLKKVKQEGRVAMDITNIQKTKKFEEEESREAMCAASFP